jgi:hypothetical protein
VVCREPINKKDVECEIPVGEGVAVVSQFACWTVWRAESAAVLREIA